MAFRSTETPPCASKSTRRRHKAAPMRLSLAAGAAVATAIAVRWSFCLILFPTLLSDVGTVGDQYYFDSYREIAIQVLSGNGYRASVDAIPCLHRPPGYVGVALLSFPYSNYSYIWFQLINGALGGLATWLTIVMASSWRVSHRAALFAGWSIALWPFLIWETKITVPENLLVALVPATFAALGRWRSTGSLLWLVATGVLAGIAALTHALYQLLLPGLLISLFFLDESRHWFKRAASICIVGATCLVVIMPWLIRNTHIAGRPVGIATGFGLHYLRGLHSWGVLSSGGRYFRDHDRDSAAFVEGILHSAGFENRSDYYVRSDPETNRFLDAEAWRDIRAKPARVVLRALVRSPVLWTHQQTPLRTLLTGLLLLPFLILSIRGVFRCWHRHLVGPLSTLLALTCAAASIYPEAIPMRYALPLLPLLILLSAHGLDLSRPRSASE